MAIENCLCEGDKYLRTRHGTGGFKQGYRGAGASDAYLRRYSLLFDELDKSTVTV